MAGLALGLLAPLFAHAQTDPPSNLEALSCSVAEGWACLGPGSTVEFYDGPDTSGTLLGTENLTISRTDITGAGVCPGVSDPVGFRYSLPASISDGNPHEIYAYGIEASTGDRFQLENAPRSITCTPTEPDLTIQNTAALLTGDEQFEFRALIENIGAGDTPGGFDVRLDIDYDNDGTVDVTDTFNTDGLESGAQRFFSVTIPITRFGNHSYNFTVNPGLASFSEELGHNNTDSTGYADFTYSDATVPTLDPGEPPEIMFFGTRKGADEPWEPGSSHPNPGEDIHVGWSAVNATKCESKDTDIYVTGDQAAGIDMNVNEPGAGVRRKIEVRCEGPGGAEWKGLYITVRDTNGPEISAGGRVLGSSVDPAKEFVVAEGNQVEMLWTSDLTDPDDVCTTLVGLEGDSGDAWAGRGTEDYRDCPSHWPIDHGITCEAWGPGNSAEDIGHNGSMTLTWVPTYDSSGGNRHLSGVECRRYTSDSTWLRTHNSIHYTVIPDTNDLPDVTLSHRLDDEGVWSELPTRNIEPGDDLVFRWNSENATSCDSVQLETHSSHSGMDDDVTEPAAGTEDTFAVTCYGPGGAATEEVTIRSVDTLDPDAVGGGDDLPDLEPTSVSLSDSSFWNPDGANGVWNNVAMRVVFGNYGSAVLPTSDVSYRFDLDYDDDGTYDVTDITSDWNGSLAIDATTPVLIGSANNIQAGTHRLRVRIDEDPDRVTEANENDNDRSVLVTVPYPNPPMDLNVNRERIIAGDTVEVDWEVSATYPLNCEVFGPGVATSFATPPAVTDSGTSDPLESTTEFVLECTNPSSGDTYTESVTVDVEPSFEEI